MRKALSGWHSATLIVIAIAGEVAQAFRDHGITAALTALIGGTMALIAAITRKTFTNEALLDRPDRDRIDRQRSEDRKAEGDRLDRIETDIRSMRDMLFDAFQRGGSD
ncbi:hypothetical protein [Pararhodobacter marinus]|uniref:hypothetical protein n=1 Tax=Pararhodobacter marinus TaxID=2184063 RepID=UPI003516217B